MTNNGTSEVYHVGRAAQLLDEMYDIQVSERKARECGIRILHNASPVKMQKFLFRSCIKDFKVKLPCEMAMVVSVTGPEVMSPFLYQFRDQGRLIEAFAYDQRNETLIGDPSNPMGFQNIVNWDFVNKDEKTEFVIKLPEGIEYVENHLHSHFINFSLDQDTLTFNKTDQHVDIIYTTVFRDEFGFPYLTEKGIFALVQYLVYLDQLKKFYKKVGNENAVTIAKGEYERAIAQARSPEILTDNQANSIMSALLSKSRHQSGNPFRG